MNDKQQKSVNPPEPSPPCPFVSELQGSSFVVKVSGALSDDGWAAHFGVFQNAMRDRSFNKKVIDNVVLDLSSCIWVDPLPLLAFTMSLGEFIQQGGKATVMLPVYDHPAVEPKRSLKFMAIEGFADQMLDLGITLSNSQRSKIDHQQIQEFAAIEVPLRYADSHCIPAWIVRLPEDLQEARDEVERGIDERLTRAEVLLRSEKQPWANTRLLYTLKVFLRETLANVAEHAYQEGAKDRLAGVYVRYRMGIQGVPSAEKENWLRELSQEEKSCPMLHRSYLENKIGCLEAFVLDGGVGMVERFQRDKIKTEKFDRLLNSVFFEGATTKKNRPTRAGGLELVHEALRQNHDYLRGFDDNLWVGFQAEYPREGADHRRPALLKGEGLPFRGLAWTARLSWPEPTVVSPQWATWQGAGPHPALTSFCHQETPVVTKETTPVVCDERFGDRQRLRDVISSTHSQHVLWLVRPGLMKNDVLSRIKDIAQEVPKTVVYLYIADIPDHEASTYLAAVNVQYEKREQWPGQFNRIVLATRSLAVSVHVYKSEVTHGYIFDDAATGCFRTEAVAWGELDIAGWIRCYDSSVFWKVIDDHKKDLTYLREKVGWQKKDEGYSQIIYGYLDFLQTLTHPRCLDLYRVAMQRFAGLFPRQTVRMQPLDRLTVTLAEEFNANQPSRGLVGPEQTEVLVRLGSVYVSGRTEDALRECGKESEPIHFFVHNSSIAAVAGSRSSLFLWSPTQPVNYRQACTLDLDETAPRYGRIGKTHAVGLGGRKHFLVPRTNQKGELLAARTPAETYNDWQQPLLPLLASGHWQYENHHDFLTLNLYQAASFAFVGHEPLARYLFREVVLPLMRTGFEQNLSPMGKQLWSRVQEDMADKKLRSDDQWKARAVIYPSHPNTEAIADKLLHCFSESVREDVRCRFIPVAPVRRIQGRGAMLLSPLAFERITKLLFDEEERPPNVLLFDDAVVSGRTMHEFNANIRSVGAKEIRMVAILDRLRLPAGVKDPECIHFFWRWDLADLGTGSACTLCKALDLTQHFSKAITSSHARQRLQDWCQIWQPASPVSQWHTALRPTPLFSPICKRLSFPKLPDPSSDIKIISDPRFQVRLKHSASVASYAAEIFTMTGLDDEALSLYAKAIKNGQPLPTQARIELFASQILFFGKEFGHDTLSDVLTQLLSAAAEDKSESEHTSLATLVVLLSTSHRLDYPRIIGEALNAAKTQEHTVNLDVQLAIANLIWNCRLNGADFPACQRLLTSSGTTIAERYDRLHLELASLDGVPHSTPLTRLSNVLQSRERTEEFPRRLIDALHSLDQHADLLRYIDVGWARSPEPEGLSQREGGRMEAMQNIRSMLLRDIKQRDRGFVQDRDKMLTKIDEATSALNSLCGSTQIPDLQNTRSRDVVRIVQNDMAKLVRRYLFFNIEREQLYSSERQLENYLSKQFECIDFNDIISDKKIFRDIPTMGISIDTDVQLPARVIRVDLIWDWYFVETMRYFLMNAVWAQHKITDPWEGKPTEMHDLWLSVAYQNESAMICICNASDDSLSNIEDALYKKGGQWHRHHIEERGGKVWFGSHEGVEGLFQVSLSIPYAGYCQSQVKTSKRA